MTIRLKRVYEPASSDDGIRILVERLWPRGVSKADAHIDRWLKAVAPSTDLRKWFNHDPAKWASFQERYAEELRHNRSVVEELLGLVSKNPVVTLVFAARDLEHNSAIVLKAFVEALTESSGAPQAFNA